MLEIEGLEVRYGGIQALRGVSLTVADGESVALIGPNGAGKSTMLNAISGLVPASAGRVVFAGMDISRNAPWDISQLGVVQVPEGRQVFADMTVGENLLLGQNALGSRDAKTSLDQVYSVFPILRERDRQLAGSLSGGQQQMLAIGRALLGAPRLLLLDEPSLGLAPVIVRQVFAALRTLKESRMTMLLVEQNASQALALADRVYVIDGGRIVRSDQSAAFSGANALADDYFGRRDINQNVEGGSR